MTLTQAKKEARIIGGTIVRTEGGDLKARYGATGETYFTDCPKDAVDTLRAMSERHASGGKSALYTSNLSMLSGLGFRFGTEGGTGCAQLIRYRGLGADYVSLYDNGNLADTRGTYRTATEYLNSL